MAYSDFTLDDIETKLDLKLVSGDAVKAVPPPAVPSWLHDLLRRGRHAAALSSEKARSEFLVVPILLATEELVGAPFAIFSGQRLDVDPSRGLVGECDFLLARTDPLPRIKTPLVAVVEAKKADIDTGIGQCVAQLVGAREFNRNAGEPERSIYGCVTTGEIWHFLKLQDRTVTLDREPVYLTKPEQVLGKFVAAFQ